MARTMKHAVGTCAKVGMFGVEELHTLREITSALGG